MTCLNVRKGVQVMFWYPSGSEYKSGGEGRREEADKKE
jgi:hypothetical protein